MAEGPAVRVRGLRDLQRAFGMLNRDIGKDIKSGLESAAQPVRLQAERLALSEISGLRRSQIPWQRMRIGVTRSSVYVAPVQRGVRGRRGRDRFRRPKFAPLLMGKAMEPALEANTERVEREVIDTLDDLFRRWERV